MIGYAAPNTMQEEKALWLRDSILGCPNPAVIHVILGMQQIKAGNFVQGQKHWRIADQQFELSQFIVNNMIELAVTDMPDEFVEILDMITVALELFPDQSYLYHTRGMYYEKHKQYPEAIEDLEYVIEKLPNLFTARKLLLDCYKATNEDEKAELVQVEIDRMIRELDETQRAAIEAFLKKSDDEKSTTNKK